MLLNLDAPLKPGGAAVSCVVDDKSNVLSEPWRGTILGPGHVHGTWPLSKVGCGKGWWEDGVGGRGPVECLI